MVMAAERSHNGMPAGWRPWGAGIIAQSKFKVFRTREADGVALSLKLEVSVPARGAQA